MRLQLILPRVEPESMAVPEVCPYEGCEGRHFRLHQAVPKAVRDTVYEEVTAERYACLRCGRTLRSYPLGVNAGQLSLRVKGLAVLLYLLGLSYGAVSLALEALGVYLAKSSVYEAVQAAAQRVPGLAQRAVFEAVQTPALGADVTSVKVNGAWLPLGLAVDALSGLVLSVEALDGTHAHELSTWLGPLTGALGAAVLVTDDADAFKTVADELGLDQQVCTAHVGRNTEALLDEMRPLAAADADGSLAALGVAPEQALADLEHLAELIHERSPDAEAELETLHRRYLGAVPPRKGQSATLAYRLRLLFLDRWNLWRRLTYYRTWVGPDGQTLDGTNNASERAIGWWIKERFRTMRGYKQPRSAVNLSRLLAFCGNHLARGGVDLTQLVA